MKVMKCAAEVDAYNNILDQHSGEYVIRPDTEGGPSRVTKLMMDDGFAVGYGDCKTGESVVIRNSKTLHDIDSCTTRTEVLTRAAEEV